MNKSVILSVVMLSLAGCSTFTGKTGNAQIAALKSAKDLSWIKKGITTQEQVQAKLGEPSSTSTSGDNTDWRYDYSCHPSTASNVATGSLIGNLTSILPTSVYTAPGGSAVAATATSGAMDATNSAVKLCNGHKYSTTSVRVTFGSDQKVNDYSFSLTTNDS